MLISAEQTRRLLSMSRLFSLLAWATLFGCQKAALPDDAAVKITGRYIVTAYIVAGDTLFSTKPTSTGFKPGINKLGIDNFAIVVERTDIDRINISTSYFRNGSRPTFNKEVVVAELPYQFTLSSSVNSTATIYEGRVNRIGKLFYQRVVGDGLLIPVVGSSIPPDQSTNQEVILVALPQ